MAVLHSAFVANDGVAIRRGQKGDSATKARCGALPGAPVDGVDAAISAWPADLRNDTLAKELSKEEETKYAPLARAASGRELAAWGEFDVFSPIAQANIEKTTVVTRWVLTWK